MSNRSNKSEADILRFQLALEKARAMEDAELQLNYARTRLADAKLGDDQTVVRWATEVCEAAESAYHAAVRESEAHPLEE